MVTRKTVVGDRNDDVKDAFRQALGRVELVIASGGLGPTQDDLTREAVAELLGRTLVRDDAVMKHIEERFRRLGRTMAEVNTRQAMVPAGAEVRDRLADLRARYAALEFVLPAGPVHGDANIGNILRRQADGVAVLIDLDGFASGPREWDLVLTAMYFERFGWHTAAEYAEFAEVYGFDVMAWPGYPAVIVSGCRLVDGIRRYRARSAPAPDRCIGCEQVLLYQNYLDSPKGP